MAESKQSKTKGKTTDAAKPNARGGIAQTVKPDAALAAVIGKDPITRAELTKKIWDYIKANNLQDAEDRRSIVADDKLRPIFGKAKVSMFEMTKLVNQHVSKE